jgi:hypothetical protein
MNSLVATLIANTLKNPSPPPGTPAPTVTESAKERS